MGLQMLIKHQVSCINSKLFFLILFYSLWDVNEYWLVERASASWLRYIPYSPKDVRRVQITDSLESKERLRIQPAQLFNFS